MKLSFSYLSGWRKAFAIAATVAAATLTGGQLAAQTGNPDARIIIGQADAPELLDPGMVPSGGRETRAIKRQIFDALVLQGSDLRPHPELAKSWTVENETRWIFELRDDVVFHNGEHFNATAAKFTLDRNMAEGSQASWRSQLVALIDSVEIGGEYQLIITTKKPAPTLLRILAFQEILAPDYFKKVGPEAFEAHPVGSGPFEFVSRDGSTVLLKRNEAYWGGAPKVAEAMFVTIPEVSSRIAALKTGEITIADNIPNDLADQLTGNVQPIRVDGTRIYFIAMNVKSPPFDNVEVRRAVANAIDRDLVVSALYGGAARPLTQDAYPEMFGYQADQVGFGYDVEASKAILSKVETPVVLDVRQNDLALAQAMQGFLSAAGLKVEVNLIEDAAFGVKIEAGQSQGYVASWGVAEGDLDAILGRHFWGGRDDTSKYTNYSNARLDELIAAGRSTTDPEQRNVYYAEAMQILVADAPWAPIVNPSELYGASTNLSGWTPSPIGLYDLRNAEISN